MNGLTRFAAAVVLLGGLCAAAQAQETKIGWTFPAEGQKARPNETIGAPAFDLGDGFSATKLKVNGREVVMVMVALPQVTREVEDSDLALVVASKVLKLPRLPSEAVLRKETEREHRFRAASGRVAGVTLAQDRKTAIVRIIPPKKP